ncbi:MAG: hypothetical protein CMH52_13530, partial [Myxococcales bacterium]|nr:hypothetical protein [Myxococcales bacterium]
PLGGLAFLGVWAGSLGVDWWTESAYECPLRVQVKSRSVEAECRRYAIRISSGFAAETRQALAKRWQNAYMGTGHCDTVVPDKMVSPWARRLALDWSAVKAVRDEPERWHRFGYETGATHAIRLEVESRAGHPDRLLSDATDLHTGQNERQAPLLLDGRLAERTKTKSTFIGVLRQGLTLVPESMALSGQLRVISNRADSDTSDENQSRSRITAKVLSVSHPDAFEKWDYDVSFGPGFGFDVFESFTLDAESDDTRFSRLSIYGLGSLTGHTPVGALSIGIGVGAGYYHFGGNRTSSPHRWTAEVVGQFSYTAFLTDTVFLRVFTEDIQPSKSIEKLGVAKIRDSGVMVGYYFQSIDEFVRAYF